MNDVVNKERSLKHFVARHCWNTKDSPQLHIELKEKVLAENLSVGL